MLKLEKSSVPFRSVPFRSVPFRSVPFRKNFYFLINNFFLNIPLVLKQALITSTLTESQIIAVPKHCAFNALHFFKERISNHNEVCLIKTMSILYCINAGPYLKNQKN